MQKMDTLRKVYQRAVSVPHNATLEIWRDYDRFETGLNKVTVSFVALSPSHSRG
jgi:cleavage stimulation factor subunit 3